ncbi:hypothetical protein L210DRAFT_3548241, partial [Boletus edulis BED1]
ARLTCALIALLVMISLVGASATNHTEAVCPAGHYNKLCCSQYFNGYDARGCRIDYAASSCMHTVCCTFYSSKKRRGTGCVNPK